jgi:alpha-tubulin suppressor-like RCC1 family protein
VVDAKYPDGTLVFSNKPGTLVGNIALRSDGTLWSWGFNGNGQLGIGDNTAFDFPVQVGTATDWSDIVCGSFHVLALKTDGTLWAWGLNNNGQLGISNNTSQNSPVQVGNETTWSKIEAGLGHSAAIKTDGSLWMWGNNFFGQLGDGTTMDANAPVQIGTDNNWKTISAGSHCIALRTNGSPCIRGETNETSGKDKASRR